MKRRITALLSLAVLFCISTSAQIFYKVEGNGLKNPSYIFGTHHLAPLSVIDEVPGCRDAYKSASQVVGEIDMTVNQMELASKIQRYMIAPADSTLSRVISREDFGRISEEFKKWAPMPGMELQMLEGMKPMVITAMVSVEMVKQKLPGYNQTEQLDTYFQLQGKATGKEVIGLETPEYQAELLYCSEPIKKQAEALVKLLDNPVENVEKSQKLNDAYLAQDIDGLFELAKDENKDSYAFMELLINKRNADWISKLPEIFNTAPTFVAVGALHLPGENGVIEGLRKAGYTVTAIKNK